MFINDWLTEVIRTGFRARSTDDDLGLVRPLTHVVASVRGTYGEDVEFTTTAVCSLGQSQRYFTRPHVGFAKSTFPAF